MSGPRVLVCGTGFGRVHLDAVADPGFPFELAGILAKGSPRSLACARRYGVPLYRDVESVPEDIDLACVVLGSAPTGGKGAHVAERLLRRGVPVLQEHPLHADELTALLRVARETGTYYRLTSHHVHVAPVRRFIDAARLLIDRQEPIFVDVVTSFQVLYTMFDVLGEALGKLRPWGFGAMGPLPEAVRARLRSSAPLRALDGMIGGVAATLRVQHELDPRQPDNHAHIWHRITLGTEGGTLTLVSGNGPVIWCPRAHLPPAAAALSGFDELTAAHLDYPTAEPLGPARAPTMAEVLTGLWPAGVRSAVQATWDAATRGEDPLPYGQYHLGLTRLTKEVSDLLGPVQLVDRAEPRVLPAATFDVLSPVEVPTC